MIRRPPIATRTAPLFPCTSLFRSKDIALAEPDPAVDHPGFPRVAVLDKGDWYQPIRFAPVSPGSPKQVIKALKKLGWEPTVFTESGRPALDQDVVPTIPLRHAGLLLKYSERAGVLATVRGSVKDGAHGWCER